ncbi:hypothetical protein BD414DRAFT_581575 [Trametes punicea]|nr:hypothetical protein BD414DRAFT_581575 [Trametes punicea]
MSDLGFNVWGAVAGAIGTIALFPVLTCWIYCQLPTAKMRILDQLLSETESVFDSAIKNGVLHGGNGLHRFSVQLWAIQLRSEDLRGQVYSIRSWSGELRSWWRGASSMINVLCKELNDLRVTLAKNSSRERRELAAAGYLNNLAMFSDGVSDSTLNSVPYQPHHHGSLGPESVGRQMLAAACSQDPPSYDAGIRASALAVDCGTTHHARTTGSDTQPRVSPDIHHALPQILPVQHRIPLRPQPSDACADKSATYIHSNRNSEKEMPPKATSPVGRCDQARHQRSTRKALLLYFGEQLSHPTRSIGPSDALSPSLKGCGTWQFKAVEWLVRSHVGLWLHRRRSQVVLIVTPSKNPRNVGSPELQCVGDALSDDDAWCDV